MRPDDRLNDEIQHHLDLLAAEHEARGMSPEAARFAARRAFGGIEPMKEQCRDRHPRSWADDLQRDVRYAFRTLGRTPGFVAVVVMSLGLGIGATAAIFGLVDAALLRPLPVRAPEQLVLFAARQPGQPLAPGAAFSYDLYQAFQRSGMLADIAASQRLDVNVDAAGVEEPIVPGQLVSGNYYAMLGVPAAAGRLIDPGDDAEDRDVAVLSHAYFQRRFGGDPSIVGKPLRVNGRTVMVVGVSAAGFSGTRPGAPADVTVPLSMQPRVMPQVETSWLHDPYQFWLELVGRLDPAVPEPRALALLNGIFTSRMEELRRAGRVGPPGAVLEFEPGAQGTSTARTRYARPLMLLLGLAVLVLVAACTNVANLLLSRALKRRHEIALRLALGANRWRLGRQLLTESLVVGLAGGFTGVVLAAWTTGLLRALLAGEPLQHVVGHPDTRVLLVAGAASLVTALAFGIAPLILMSRVDPQQSLKTQGARAVGGGAAGHTLLVGIQVAVSLLLLVGAGLFLRTLVNLRTADLGFDQQEVLTLRLEPQGSNQKREPDGTFKTSLLRTYGELLQRIESLPGVRSAALAGITPLGDENALTVRIRRPGAAARDDDPQIRMIQIYPKYFSTTGIRVLAGRDLADAENTPAAADAAVRAVVINRTLAQQRFGGPTAAVGGRFLVGTASPRVFEIVGVVEDVRDLGAREAVLPTTYATYAQAPTGRAQMTLFVRSAGDSAAIGAAVRSLARSADPTMPLRGVESLAERVAGSINQERLVALFASVFGAISLLLASIGLYGVAAYAVACREKELGVRLALGASKHAIVSLLFRGSFRVVAAGSAAGLLGAVAVSRLVETRLFGVSPGDPITMAAAVTILAGVAALATFVPARRASRLDPLIALRSE